MQISPERSRKSGWSRHTRGNSRMSFSVFARRRARRTWLLRTALAAALVAVCSNAQAAEPCSQTAPWDRLGTTGRNFVRPVPLALTTLAVAAPFGFAPTGLDQQLRVVAQRALGGRPNLEPVSVWTPYVLGAGLIVGYGVSAALGSCSAKRRLAPVIQAGVLSFT